MPGGNTSSRKRGHRMLKGASQMAPDVKALSGGETFGSEGNMQLFGRGGEYTEDTEYGLSSTGETPNGGGYKGNAQGYTKEKPSVGSPAPSRSSKPAKSADPTPGGGW